MQEISLRALRLSLGYRGLVIELCQSNFKTTDPGCHGNEIWDNTGYNSARIENIAVSLAPSRGYSLVSYWMMSYKFYHDQPCWHGKLTNPVGMATKFKAKSPKTRLLQQISPRCLRLPGRFSGTGYQMMSIKFYNDRPGCHGNENWDKTDSARIENIAVLLAPSRWYSWVGYWMMSVKFYHDQPRGNEI